MTAIHSPASLVPACRRGTGMGSGLYFYGIRLNPVPFDGPFFIGLGQSVKNDRFVIFN
jgi:hypothetical protein